MLGLYTALETAMDEAKDIKPNLDYPAGPAYHLMGFDTETFTPLFVAAGSPAGPPTSWSSYASNSLIRPLSAYNGPEERHLSARG